MTTTLIYGEPGRSPALRHELPLQLAFAALVADHEGTRHVLCHHHESERVAELGEVVVHPLESLADVVDRVRSLGIGAAVVPPDFPLELADRLRAGGVALETDAPLFVERRRRKTPVELEGIRRAQRAADAAMRAVTDAMRDGARSCEALKTIVARTLIDLDCNFDWMIVSHGAQTADPLDPGSGEILPGEPVLVDLFPRDLATACFADMTRTFCVGPVPDRLRAQYDACDEARRLLTGAIRAGASTSELAQLGNGALRAADGEVLHMFSHGVGLEVIEPPEIGAQEWTLVAGDVISLEPALYVPGWGGCRIEDLLHVTDDGAEVLTDFPYVLEL